MVKASTFMYSIIIIVTVFAVLGGFISSLSLNYNVNIPAQDNKTLNILKNMTAVNVYIHNQTNTGLSEDKTPKTWIGEALDILGLWFERGLATIKLIPNVLTFFEAMFSAAIESSSGLLGTAYQPLKFMVIGLVTVAIIMGVIVSTLLKKDV